ncbi:hypothetical protein GCM10023075_58640 [Streptosporangium album]
MDWGYSNTNYILAGMVIERATGGTLADEISRRITHPLGLAGTYLPRGDDPTICGPHSRHYSKLYLTDPGAEIYDVTEMDLGGTYYNTNAQVEALQKLLRKLPDLTTPAPPSAERPKPGQARQLDDREPQKALSGSRGEVSNSPAKPARVPPGNRST